ncbi:MAG TPA: hypothetical protein VF309_01900, partial [Usitatibacter sp.]
QQSNIIFVAMYTYDASGNPVWYVVSNCPILAGGCTGSLFRVRGGTQPTRPWSGSGIAVSTVGSMTLAFSDVNNATMSFSIDGVNGFKTITRQIFVAPTPPVNTNLAKSTQLVGGAWTYVYTIVSTFTDTMRFTSVDTTPSATGTYYAHGTDQFGGLVIGGYDPTVSTWLVVDPGVIIDQAYVFNFSDNNDVTGCYYQINPPGSANLSRCYSLFGFRSPAQADAPAAKTRADAYARELQVSSEVMMDRKAGVAADPRVVESYLEARKSIR